MADCVGTSRVGGLALLYVLGLRTGSPRRSLEQFQPIETPCLACSDRGMFGGVGGVSDTERAASTMKVGGRCEFRG